MGTNERETRTQIMDAAEALFARDGYAATTIKRIGGEAGANPALIYYYFGSKEGLYRALMERLFGMIVREGGRRLDPSLPPDEAIRRLVLFQSETMTVHPQLPRLMAREMVDHAAEHAGEEVARLAETLVATLRERIREGQAAGLFRRDLDPRRAALSVVSLIPYFHLALPVAGTLLGGAGEPTREETEAYGRHAADFVLAALRAPGAGEPR